MPLVTSGGHPVLNARARTKVLSEAPSKPRVIGGNGGKTEYSIIKSRGWTANCNTRVSLYSLASLFYRYLRNFQ